MREGNRFIQCALLVFISMAASSCQVMPVAVSGERLARIVSEREKMGAFVSLEEVSPTRYEVEFNTPAPLPTSSLYRHERYLIRKSDLDARLRARIERLARH